MSRWERFFRNIQQDLKLYLYILVVLSLFRIGFIGLLHQYLQAGSTGKDIVEALYYGTRLSLKSAGGITLLAFLGCTVVNIFLASANLQRIRRGLGYGYIILLSILFQARIPYYEQFHMAFNQFIFNTFKDDPVAIFYTLVQQYNLVMRLLYAAVIAYVLCKGWKWLLTIKVWRMPRFSKKYQTIFFRTAIVFSICVFALFTRFGGSLTYGGGINWESAAKSKDEFLNEAILDDVQALYRAYSLNEILKNAKHLHINKENMLEYASYAAGHDLQSNQLDDYLKKQAQGAAIKTPKHIFLIIGESYAEWPLLSQYKALNIANGMKSILSQDNAFQVQAFLPTSTSTMAGVNGIITGFPEGNLSTNYQPESYKEPYATALAVQMKKLGYKTYFWYSGFSSWQRIKDFTLSQGFDEFYGSSDFQKKEGNAWGTEDKYFLNNIAAEFKDDQPSFHVILTGSNHPPFTVNLQQEGFDENIVVGGLPEHLKKDKEWITKLGHFWYADKVLTEFVQNMYHKYPDSLFIITGDHADRMNIEPNPALYERYAVPLIFYGQGITKELLPSHVAGSHMNIAPTLLELIAPQGFTYYSAGQSLTRGNQLGFNDSLWISAQYIGKIGTDTVTVLPWETATAQQPKLSIIQQEVDAMRAIAWWRITRGKSIE